MEKPRNTEMDANTYIAKQLDLLGWVVKNPARNSRGEVYKQNECLANKEIKKQLNAKRPEAVVRLNEKEVWVIEAKREKKQIGQALKEAEQQYAKKLNKSEKIKCVLISGVAGNDTDGFTVQTKYLHKNTWKTIKYNKRTKDTLLAKEQVAYILENDTSEYTDLPDIPQEKYQNSGEEINEILHTAGINKNKRARFIAGLVLSISTDSEINLRETDCTTIVENINTLIRRKLNEVNKSGFFEFLSLETPPTQENHIKYREAIVKTIIELQTLDIKNAMNSGNDVLGEFYEAFLKYGNGAKEIGIVLTPRHITRFASKVLNIKHNDFVLDPACGTGGFLVASLDYVSENSNDSQLEKFKKNRIFGIEQDDEVVALALVNMIFRGDGRHNMSEGNCFNKKIIKNASSGNGEGTFVGTEEEGENIISRVLMNPPFALKNEGEKERKFISHALSMMIDGGLLFAIIPISVMVKGGENKNWRKEMLESNTLISVLTFPEDLFYPVSVGTVGIFIKKGVPHNLQKQKVYFARCISDGHRKKKGKRVIDKNTRNIIEEIENELKEFMENQTKKIQNVPEVKKSCLLDHEDKKLELVPEKYLDSRKLSDDEIRDGMEEMILESIAFKIKYAKKLNKES